MSDFSTPVARIGNLRGRRRKERAFYYVCLGATCFAVLLLVVLLARIWHDGASFLSVKFLRNFSSRFPDSAGVKPALYGTLWIMGLTGLFALPIGIAAAVYLEEFAPKNRPTDFIQLNIANLAGVPSIVYGLLGLAIFVRYFGLGRSVLAASLTMSLLILPMVIISTQEALRAVPGSLREGSFGLGATHWQTIRHQVLPSAFSGILTGVILSLSRAIGESAPLLLVGAATYINYVPAKPTDGFTAMPIQIFNWAGLPQKGFQNASAAAIIVLLAALLLMNSVAIVIRQRQRNRF